MAEWNLRIECERQQPPPCQRSRRARRESARAPPVPVQVSLLRLCRSPRRARTRAPRASATPSGAPELHAHARTLIIGDGVIAQLGVGVLHSTTGYMNMAV